MVILRSGQSREQRAEQNTTVSCSVQLELVISNSVQLCSTAHSCVQLYSTVCSCVQLCSTLFSCVQLCSVVFSRVQSRSAAAVCSMFKACWREVFSCSQRARSFSSSSSSSCCVPLLRPTAPVSCAPPEISFLLPTAPLLPTGSQTLY